MGSSRAYSAPGKALIAGGYLVLRPGYKAYVVALSARMHAVVRSGYDKSQTGVKLIVTSSQFNGDRWIYIANEDSGYNVLRSAGSNNVFIERVLFNLLNYYYKKGSVGETSDNIIEVDIYSDAGYHSQSASIVKRNSYKQFNYHDSSITDVPKTGLGSSAGLVTVLVTAISSVYDAHFNLSSEKQLKKLHNLAQISHCQAQGKIGSGFDVAAAVYGSIMYQRFDSSIISDLPPTSNKNEYGTHLVKVIDDIDWKVTTNSVRLPEDFRLIMGDVANGSETVKLVTTVNKWYDDNFPRSKSVFDEINRGNMLMIECLQKLQEFRDKDFENYKTMIEQLDDKSTCKQGFYIVDQIREAVDIIRSNFRLITKESGADIEPEVQSRLLDACMNLESVLTGVIPGAGGYDAIALITTKNIDLHKLKGPPIFDSVTWLDLDQADSGIKQEDPQHYCGLR